MSCLAPGHLRRESEAFLRGKQLGYKVGTWNPPRHTDYSNVPVPYSVVTADSLCRYACKGGRGGREGGIREREGGREGGREG